MSSLAYEPETTLESIEQVTPLPVLQLRSWTPVDAPGHFLIACVGVALFLLLIQIAVGRWMALAAGVSLALALWRLWVPARFELDSRGIQQIVLGHRAFWPWCSFARYEIDPLGVCLIASPQREPLARVNSLTIVAPRHHLRLVQLVATYVAPASLPDSGSQTDIHKPV